MEGVGSSPGAHASGEGSNDDFFWGENLLGVKSHPITLNEPSKLIYSPRIFGPDVAMHEYFNDRHFPNNLEEVFQRHFGFVPHETGQPVIIGEHRSLFHIAIPPTTHIAMFL